MSKPSLLTRVVSYFILFFVALLLGGTSFLLQQKSSVFRSSLQPAVAAQTSPFPVSVNTQTGEIFSNPTFDTYYETTFADANTPQKKLLGKLAAVLSSKSWYQSLASPVSRIVVIWPGERKEEVAKHIGDILGWNSAQRIEFQELIDAQSPALKDGKYFPGQYVTHRSASPLEVASLISTKFTEEVIQRYPKTVSDQVPLKDALIIASLLEREASDFQNKREVAGVIWNRLFIDMPLQLDATLQYVKGTNPRAASWWPVVKPADKFLESAFNSYQNKGLPPTPIANPSAEAILAALNPVQTDCFYYFHGPNADYYCSVDYEEHVTKLKAIYGRGR
jgi:cell division protein YceG involved in septum cleavage